MNAHGQPMYSIKLSKTLIKAFNKPNKTHVETKTGLVGSKVYRKVVSNRKVIGGNPKTKKTKKRRRRRRRKTSLESYEESETRKLNSPRISVLLFGYVVQWISGVR